MRIAGSIFAVLCGLARIAAADEVVWNDRVDASTCYAERPSLDDWSLVDSWIVVGPMLDPAHAGWAAIDSGCGRTSVALRLERAPLTTDSGANTVSLPIRLRVASDWTAYATPALTGANELANLPLALARRVRALSPYHWLTTFDLAVLAPTSTVRMDRAVGAGLAGAVSWTGIPVTTLHATLTFDVQRPLDGTGLARGSTLQLGAEWHWLRFAELVAELGQREDGDYHLWTLLGARAMTFPLTRDTRVMAELAITRDLVAPHDASAAWIALSVVR